MFTKTLCTLRTSWRDLGGKGLINVPPKTGTAPSFGQTGIYLAKNLEGERKQENKKEGKNKEEEKEWYVYCPLLSPTRPSLPV